MRISRHGDLMNFTMETLWEEEINLKTVLKGKV